MRPGRRMRSSDRAALLLAATCSCAAFSLSSLPNKWTPFHQISKRDITSIPPPISVAPSQYWDGADGPWSSFPLQVGQRAQDIRVMVSTAAYNVWAVNSQGCPSFYPSSCGNERGGLFMSNESITWTGISDFTNNVEANLNISSSGSYGFDTVTLGWQGSGGPTCNHTVINTYADPRFYVGMFGMKPIPTNFTNFVEPQPSWMQSLENTSAIPSLSYGYTAGNQYRFNKVLGSLTLGGYDQARFDTTQRLSVDMAADVSRDLVIAVQSITTNKTSAALTQSQGGFYALIDTTVPQLWLPIDVCKAFEAAFGLVYEATTGFYLVNSQLHASLLASNPTVTFTLGATTSGGSTIKITLPYSAFDLTVSYPVYPTPGFSSPYFPLRQAVNESQYTLGRAFLQEAYLIADYNHHNFTVAPCAWSAQMPTELTAIVSPSWGAKSDGSGGANIGMIVGVAIGALLLVVLAGVGVFLVRKRRTRRALRNEKPKSISPSDSGNFSPFHGTTMNGSSDASFQAQHGQSVALNHELPVAGAQIGELASPDFDNRYKTPVSVSELESPQPSRGYPANSPRSATRSSASPLRPMSNWRKFRSDRRGSSHTILAELPASPVTAVELPAHEMTRMSMMNRF